MESSLKLYTTLIYAAILKYRISAFKLEILEYCDESVVRSRETYYIKGLKPEYNILSPNEVSHLKAAPLYFLYIQSFPAAFRRFLTQKKYIYIHFFIPNQWDPLSLSSYIF